MANTDNTETHLEHEAMDPETGLTLNPDFIHDIETAIEAEDTQRLIALVEPLHAADQAELLDRLSHDERVILTAALRTRFDSEVLSELSPEAAEDVIEALGTQASAVALAELPTDDAIHIIEDLAPEDQRDILNSMPAERRDELAATLQYPEDSAGRLMRHELVTVPESWTVGDTIDYLREANDLPETFYVIYAVTPSREPVGRLLLSTILHNKRDAKLTDIMQPELYAVMADTDQEEVAFLFRKYALVEAPVVDHDGILVGTITVDDVVDVIQEEEEEDYLRSSGVTSQDFHSGVVSTVKARFGWLFLNLLTAVLSVYVVSLFEGSIEQLVTLAIVMPMIASMCGNTGTQTEAVAIRAIAMRHLVSGNRLGYVRKETIIGLINGLGIGVIMALGAWAWFGDPLLSLVLLMASIICMTVAGMFGALVPILMQRLNLDPALSSTIFLTTVTDCIGFFSFLGLATIILL